MIGKGGDKVEGGTMARRETLKRGRMRCVPNEAGGEGAGGGLIAA